MTEWSSRFDVGEKIAVGDIQAVVTSVMFDDKIASPQVQLTWIANGEVKTAWLRESAIRYIVEGKIYGT